MVSPFACGVRLTGGFPTYDVGVKGNSHRSHTGQDYVPVNKNIESNWNLYAVDNGEVIRNTVDKDYGNMIVLRCGQYVVLYGHMKSKSPLKVGAKVFKGERIGTAGNTGNSTGRHLHIEVQKASTWAYGKNLVCPSDVIDFGSYSKEEVKEEVQKWKNGSTMERVYQTVAECKKGVNYIGALNPREECDCYGKIDDCYLVVYDIAGSTKKCGFVKYAGGIK